MDGRCVLILLLADAILSITISIEMFLSYHNIMCLVIEPRKTEFDDPSVSKSKSEQNVLSFICI